MKLLISMLCCAITVGCAGEYRASYDKKNEIWEVSYRSGDTRTFVPEEKFHEAEKAAEEAAKKPPTRAELITALGEIAGDTGLGAELVVIAEEFGDRQFESAHENSLRVSTWIHERETKRLDSPRRRAWGDVERRARRAEREDLD